MKETQTCFTLLLSKHLECPRRVQDFPFHDIREAVTEGTGESDLVGVRGVVYVNELSR